MKRALDLTLATIALILLSPLLLPVMLVLRLTGEGEVFYRQRRIGRGGTPFDILKFATMLKNSPNMSGGDITSGGDPRILPVGRFLRDTKINELPQLLNILSGDMSFIGPRPLTESVAALFPSEHWAAVKSLRPGLSGIGSVVFRDEETLLFGAEDRRQLYAAAIVPHKAALEKWYAEHQTAALDIKLMVLTALAVLRPGLDASRYLRDLPAEPPVLRELRQRNRVRRA